MINKNVKKLCILIYIIKRKEASHIKNAVGIPESEGGLI